jgi:orotidine-5'-phosphate decarboxylase
MIINQDRSIIPACDVTLERFWQIVKATADIEKVGAYKVGISFLDVGLKSVVEIARQYSDKPVIYDHQKAGTDIPDTPDAFMESMTRAGIDAVILFPQAGPATQYEWTLSAKDHGLGVIVGGEMTHPRYLHGDSSEGKKKNYSEIFEDLGMSPDTSGYLGKDAPDTIYEIAARMGVSDFVVPGNKPDRISHYKSLIEKCGTEKPVFYSPGLVAQGGKISDGAKAAGDRFHAIVGRGIYNADDIRKAAEDLTKEL